MSELPDEKTLTKGEMYVILRRMEALRETMIHGDVNLMPFAWDQTYRAMTKAFGIERG